MIANAPQSALAAHTFPPLPLGSIRPSGWLRDQLRIQADGLSGHLDEFWPDVAESGWIGGSQEGWERGPYWLDGLVPLAYLLDDRRLQEKATRWIETIIANQHDDGWLGTVRDKLRGDPSGSRPGKEVYNSFDYDPWPRAILLKALIQFHEATNDARIIPVLQRFLRKLDALLETHWLRSWARYRWADLALSVHWLYDRTEEPWLLTLAERLQTQGFDWPHHFARFPFRDKVTPIECDLTSHGPNNAMAIKAPAVWYRQSHDAQALTTVDLMIEMLDTYHGQATGMFSCDEHLAGRSPSQGSELCAVVEYMYSLEILIATLGQARHADRLEMLAFNALPATMSADMWTHQYDQQVNQVVCQVARPPVYTSNGPDANLFGLEPHFGCCTANLHQGWPKFASHLWARTQDRGLAALAYAPCVVETEIDDQTVRLTVETEYPFRDGIRITVDVSGCAPVPIHLRIPTWAEDPSVRLNDGEHEMPRSGTFHRLDCRDGRSVIDLRFGMPVRIAPGVQDSVSLFRGPLLFGLKMGERWEKVTERPTVDDWAVHPTTPWNYALEVGNPADIQVTQRAMPAVGTPFAPDAAPISLQARGRRVPAVGYGARCRRSRSRRSGDER